MGYTALSSTQSTMAVYGPFHLSGEGSIDIGAFGVPTDILVKITAPGRTQFVSNSAPRRVMHAGWYGWGLSTGGTGGWADDPLLVWWKFVEHEFEDDFTALVAGNLNPSGDTVFYHCDFGVNLDITVYL